MMQTGEQKPVVALLLENDMMAAEIHVHVNARSYMQIRAEKSVIDIYNERSVAEDREPPLNPLSLSAMKTATVHEEPMLLAGFADTNHEDVVKMSVHTA